ncbi:2,4-diaminobutyrate decarboxylase [Pseudohongiella nitratireducens]|uniref:2,4-diaminobutyrate decarboxylase n=1 Tax=Pseudohongiella nitratireducens TaxID=1768907 RepID=A0A917GRC2_9GAMM|nr:putative pyridoxal-dependent aspartate 1-decarboxylase [Pseudohongiella nitratireducens]MDF1624410.1 putative pyridoxal-dependent aspartate 1-decarboxylase [Pseudohongiella nitratireducens]GGG54636.1 2,4-diaminobutyrate decarboxylase [Pseudohongiella nitratireducens]
MSDDKKLARASLDSLYRIFTVPEAPDSTLGRIDQSLSQDLAGFLQQHIVASERDLADIESDFDSAAIPEHPTFVSEQIQFVMDKLVAQSVHISAPSFVGHMASALPYFMLPLSRIMMALNQNLVKVETSKAFTPMERQVVGMIHKLVYDNDEAFYEHWMHDRAHALGSFCSGGTIANLTALWAARNNALPPGGDFRGLGQDGLLAGMQHHGYQGLAILVSERGHYSLGKAADILGIGRRSLIAIPTDNRNKVRTDLLASKCDELKRQNIRVMAIVGIAGASETGSVDPLDTMADIAAERGIHFHVDSAWGGPTLFSSTHRHLLKGIERADSVTLDAHKQLYVPMGAGIAVFRDPKTLTSVEHHAEYIIRKGSKDLGSHTVEGSRPGMAILVHSGLHIIGRQGYELLIDQGIEKARAFAQMIRESDDFELVSEPELNILTYRYVPADIAQALAQAPESLQRAVNEELNKATKRIQKIQRGLGKSFVSRTRLNPALYDGDDIIVFRAVLANPLTNTEILSDLLEEQRQIAATRDDVKTILGLARACFRSC